MFTPTSVPASGLSAFQCVAYPQVIDRWIAVDNLKTTIPHRVSTHLPELSLSARVKVCERTPIPVFVHDRSIYTVIRSTPSRVKMVKAS